MAIEIGKVLLELLAAIIIQFFPVQTFVTDQPSWTWADNEGRFYHLAVKASGNSASYLFTRFDGETLSEDSLKLLAVKGKDNRYSWIEFQANGEQKSTSFFKPLIYNPEIRSTNMPLLFGPWIQRPALMMAKGKQAINVKGLGKRYELQFSDKGAIIDLVLYDNKLHSISFSLGSTDSAQKYQLILQ